MAFTYPLTMPTSPGIQVSKFGVQFRNKVFRSMNETVQVAKEPGDLWVYEFRLPKMTRAQAAAWQAWGMKLQGRFGTFYAADPDATTARGVGTGTPLVNGASQVGTSIITDGWTISQTGILIAGDYIEIEDELYMVTDDANSDGSGNATFNISPAIPAGNAPADNAAITVSSAQAIFRLTSDDMIWDVDALSIYGMTFKAIQDR